MESLDQAVSEGDLILLYVLGQRAFMFLVESCPDSQISNPKISSITVREVKVGYLDEPGRCVVSGPDVYYNEEEDDDTSEDDDSSSEVSYGLTWGRLNLRGGCSVDQSCPVCLGYDFAMDDKIRSREVGEYETRLSRGECSFGCYGEPEELKQEILKMVRERYEFIDARRQEMGLSGYDVDDIVESWFADGDDE
ncbi:unnamed protein product [Aspergillus oryzae]|uniref:Unnamed protein product n=1 Tax=Aspergillus oryzae TaxID=5062 RepID=A0AAN4YVC5_ASPOZ|nr:unnamed protein product [Aspergillus oryzae]GMF95720.1 unnamed protein product [Aspergillus oryzae]GMG35003.1 unnamed protein product [Aspergillus oryzae]